MAKVQTNEFPISIYLSEIIQPKTKSPYFEQVEFYNESGNVIKSMLVSSSVFSDTLNSSSNGIIYIVLKPAATAPEFFNFVFGGERIGHVLYRVNALKRF